MDIKNIIDKIELLQGNKRLWVLFKSGLKISIDLEDFELRDILNYNKQMEEK